MIGDKISYGIGLIAGKYVDEKLLVKYGDVGRAVGGIVLAILPELTKKAGYPLPTWLSKVLEGAGLEVLATIVKEKAPFETGAATGQAIYVPEVPEVTKKKAEYEVTI